MFQYVTAMDHGRYKGGELAQAPSFTVTLNQRVSAATEATLSLLEVSPSVSPLLLMSLLITLLCMLWRTIIWIFAIKHTHGITVRKSVFVAVVPTLVAVILTVVGAV